MAPMRASSGGPAINVTGVPIVNVAPPSTQVPPPSRENRAPGNQRKLYTLDECRNIALRTNSDIQVELWEEMARGEIKNANLIRTLPHPVISADFGSKVRQAWPYDIAQDGWYDVYKLGAWRYFAELRWSPNDAVLGFLVSKTDCNEATKSRYMRVRMAQKILGSLEPAFFRLLSLQECLPLAEKLVSLRSNLAKETQELKKDRLADLEEYHRAEQKAAQARLMVNKLRTELERQRTLVTLTMGLPADTCGAGGLFAGGTQSTPAPLPQACDLEMQALRCRPEAVIEGLNQANCYNEVLKSVVKFFPRATGFMRYGQVAGNHSHQKDIKEMDVLVCADLLEWVANIKEYKAAQARNIKAAHRNGAMALAIISDVRMSAIRCTEAQEDLKNLEESLGRAKKQLQAAQSRQKAGVLEEVVVDELRGNLFQEEIERIRLVGETNARLAELSCAMGTNYTEGAPVNSIPCLGGRFAAGN
jgi:outer membrane protein